MISRWRAQSLLLFCLLLLVDYSSAAAIFPSTTSLSNHSVSANNNPHQCIPQDPSYRSLLAKTDDCHTALFKLPISNVIADFRMTPRPDLTNIYELPKTVSFGSCRIYIDLAFKVERSSWDEIVSATSDLIDRCARGAELSDTGGVGHTGLSGTMRLTVENVNAPAALNLGNDNSSVNTGNVPLILAPPSPNASRLFIEGRCFDQRPNNDALAFAPDCVHAIRQLPFSSRHAPYTFTRALHPDPDNHWELPKSETYRSCRVTVDLAFVKREMGTWSSIQSAAESLTIMCTLGRFPNNVSGGVVTIGQGHGIRIVVGSRHVIPVSGQ